MNRSALAAAIIGPVATALAAAVVLFGGTGIAVVGGALRDRWAPALAPASPALTVVVRDAAAEARFGAGPWDRAVLARVVTGLSLAGAGAIGLDAGLGEPSAPGRGGAASDLLLRDAIAQAGDVVFLLGVTPGSAAPAERAGHPLAPPDPDGVVRRVPLFHRVQGHAVPAFGVLLAATALRLPPEELAAAIPTDGAGRAVLRWAPDLQVTPFSELFAALERGDRERLRALAEGKVVVVVTQGPGLSRATPIGALWDFAVQAEIVNAVLARAWLRETPPAVTLALALVLAWLTAWLALALRSWQAPAAEAGLTALYAVAFVLAPAATGVVLPALVPLGALALAGAGALGWSLLGARGRLRRLEGEVAGIREALARRESAVEALEEDLETARDRLQTAEALQGQLAEARAQEEQARGRLQALERELRAADRRPGALGDAEQERLGSQAAELGIVTRDPALLALFRDLARAARASLPILISGEPGTGKELFARAAHRLSPRAAGPFVAVNMAAIAPELFESELFGHVRGSFTGAVAERKGFFEQADRGTLFLDEIGDLRADHQSKLLRELQEKSFHRVGAGRPTAVDVRIVAASNRDLARGVAEGWFREDLYFRLKGVVLSLPPLRERCPDVAPLAERFVEEAAAEAGRPVALSEAAMRALERHDWPGNVRELQNCLRRAVALSDRPVLAADDLGLAAPPPAGEPPADADGDTAVLACLRRHAFDMQASARALGWDRSTVTQRLKGLGFRALVDAGGDRARAALALAGDPALARVVEVKLGEYHEHLMRSIAGLDSADAAVAACRRRFKNLADRHFRSLEALVRQELARRG